MRYLLSLLLYWLTLGPCMSQNLFFENLNMGPDPVGFRTLLHIDSSRIYGSGPRPLLISIWYPARNNNGTPVTFGQYIDIAANKSSITPLSASALTEARLTFINNIAKRGASRADLQQLLQTTTLSYFETEAVKQKKPLVISLQGGGRPAYTQFILNEFLASHGYIVASIADIREAPDRGKTSAAGNARALAMDIGIVKTQMQQLTNGKVATIGFSKAGEAILLHQLLNEPFTAQVMMDAQPGKEADAYLTSASSTVLETPTLAFSSNHQNNLTLEQALADSIAFPQLAGNRLKIRLMEANHGDLTSAGILGNLINDYNRWPAFGDSALSHQMLCQLTKLFLDHYLKGINKEAEVEALLSSLRSGFVVSHKIVK